MSQGLNNSMTNEAIQPELLEWGVAAATMEGQSESGDRALVAPFPGGTLVAVIDGVGHGGEAAIAAEAALRVLRERPEQEIGALFRLCHEALKQTRGAVISLAAFHAAAQTMTWIGVGNVEGVLLRPKGSMGRAVENVLLMSGLVGFHLPNLHPSTTAVMPGDMLIFATDGIRPDFGRETAPNESPRRIAERICARHKKGTDDALVLVARYLGPRT
jgi:phosphoserine phosphatase RsbX